MKHTIHTPTEQFGYVETEFDAEEGINLHIGPMERHNQIVEIAKPQEGLPTPEFNALLDEYLEHNSINADPGITERMSVQQMAIIQNIKRSRARIAHRNA